MRPRFAINAASRVTHFVTEGWKRTASLSCAVLVLVIAGAAMHALTPRAINARQLAGAIVDGLLTSDRGILPDHAGLRVTLDRRQAVPAFDRAPPLGLLAPVLRIDVETPEVVVEWADNPVGTRASLRLTRYPRGPPTAASIQAGKHWLVQLAFPISRANHPHGVHHR